jgi:hypothetical protein
MGNNYQLIPSWFGLTKADFDFRIGLTYEPRISKNMTVYLPELEEVMILPKVI